MLWIWSDYLSCHLISELLLLFNGIQWYLLPHQWWHSQTISKIVVNLFTCTCTSILKYTFHGLLFLCIRRQFKIPSPAVFPVDVKNQMNLILLTNEINSYLFIVEIERQCAEMLFCVTPIAPLDIWQFIVKPAGKVKQKNHFFCPD